MRRIIRVTTTKTRTLLSIKLFKNYQITSKYIKHNSNETFSPPIDTKKQTVSVFRSFKYLDEANGTNFTWVARIFFLQTRNYHFFCHSWSIVVENNRLTKKKKKRKNTQNERKRRKEQSRLRVRNLSRVRSLVGDLCGRINFFVFSQRARLLLTVPHPLLFRYAMHMDLLPVVFAGRNDCAHSLELSERERGKAVGAREPIRFNSIRLYRVNGPAVALIEQFCTYWVVPSAYRLPNVISIACTRFGNFAEASAIAAAIGRYAIGLASPIFSSFRFISPFALYRSRSSISSWHNTGPSVGRCGPYNDVKGFNVPMCERTM